MSDLRIAENRAEQQLGWRVNYDGMYIGYSTVRDATKLELRVWEDTINRNWEAILRERGSHV